MIQTGPYSTKTYTEADSPYLCAGDAIKGDSVLSVIINPAAGNGAGAAIEGSVLKELDSRGLEYMAHRTVGAGHATQLAREAVEAGRAGVVVVGGDGTLFEAVNGIRESGIRLYIVPCGTGNDFMSVLPYQGEAMDKFRQQLDGGAAPYDLGRAGDYAFINESGAGFDVEVLEQTAKHKSLGGGIKPYLLGVRDALKSYRPIQVKITAGDFSYEGRIAIYAVGNGRCIGGGMKVTPKADPSDGLFDVVVVRSVPRALIALLVPFFIFGLHIHLPITKTLRCRELTVEPAGEITVNMDGELRNMQDKISYSIVAGGLMLSTPGSQ